MSNFTPLTEKEAAAYSQFEKVRDGVIRFTLLRHVAQARVRVAAAASTGLDPTRRTHARALAALTKQASAGYARLEKLHGAIRFCTDVANIMALKAGIRRQEMSVPIPFGVVGGQGQLVPDATYLPVLTGLIETSAKRCFCSIFIVDLSPLRDQGLLVEGVLRSLAAARWRGVDVRLLVGGSRENLDIAETADTARARAIELGIDCRWVTSRPQRGSHAKMVIADDAVLTGSHNWSAGAFTTQVQDSVLVISANLAAYLGTLFEQQWQGAAGASS